MCADGNSAVEAVLDEPPDVLFLDVAMPGRDGFAVVEALLEHLPPETFPLIVFVTAFDQHALRAFEAQALDYLVKPFDDDRFATLLDRVRRLVRQSRVEAVTGQLRRLLGERGASTSVASSDEDGVKTALPGGGDGVLDHLVLRTGKRSRIVRTEEVDWIGADGVYARIHVGGSSYLIRMPMHELETRLDARRFVRIHRSAIVNIDRVRELHEIDRGEYAVILSDGTKLKLSRSRRAQFESRLGQSL
jgi:two-component system, LytTR family, response regulator